MEAVAVTNTIPQAENMKMCPKIKVSVELTVEPLFEPSTIERLLVYKVMLVYQ